MRNSVLAGLRLQRLCQVERGAERPGQPQHEPAVHQRRGSQRQVHFRHAAASQNKVVGLHAAIGGRLLFVETAEVRRVAPKDGGARPTRHGLEALLGVVLHRAQQIEATCVVAAYQ